MSKLFLIIFYVVSWKVFYADRNGPTAIDGCQIKEAEAKKTFENDDPNEAFEQAKQFIREERKDHKKWDFKILRVEHNESEVGQQ